MALYLVFTGPDNHVDPISFAMVYGAYSYKHQPTTPLRLSLSCLKEIVFVVVKMMKLVQRVKHLVKPFDTCRKLPL